MGTRRLAHVRYLLDTHVWIWAQLNPELLSRRAADLIADPVAECCLSPITLYETALLAERGRIQLESTAAEWIRTSLARRPMTVLDITAAIALRARELPGFENPDPFGRFLLATAATHGIPIVTRDVAMTEWAGVPTIW